MGLRLGVCLALLAVSGAAAQQAKSEEQERTRLQRLAAVGELWGQVRYRHPWMLSRRIDWDAAAVQSMLDALEAPATKVKSAQLRNEKGGAR